MENIVLLEPNLKCEQMERKPYESIRHYQKSALTQQEIQIYNYKHKKLDAKLAVKGLQHSIVFEDTQLWESDDDCKLQNIKIQNIEPYYRIFMATKKSKYMFAQQNILLLFIDQKSASLMSLFSNKIIAYYERVKAESIENKQQGYIIAKTPQIEYIHSLLQKYYAKSQTPKQFKLPLEIDYTGILENLSEELMKKFNVKILSVNKSQMNLQGLYKSEAIEYINKIAVLMKEKEFQSELKDKESNVDKMQKAMEKLNIATRDAQAKIKKLSTINMYPSYWLRNKDNQGITLVQLDPNENSKEYLKIAMHLLQTVSCKIISIYRIQNTWIWRLYHAERNNFKEFGIPLNERYFFHGTKTTHPSKIYNSEVGLDVLYSNEGLWGRGVYLAAEASYSDRGYAYIKNNKKQLFYVRAVMGYTVPLPQGDVKELPMNLLNGRKFDSLCEEKTVHRPNTIIYVVKRSVQTYPEYLIKYTLI